MWVAYNLQDNINELIIRVIFGNSSESAISDLYDDSQWHLLRKICLLLT